MITNPFCNYGWICLFYKQTKKIDHWEFSPHPRRGRAWFFGPAHSVSFCVFFGGVYHLKRRTPLGSTPRQPSPRALHESGVGVPPRPVGDTLGSRVRGEGGGLRLCHEIPKMHAYYWMIKFGFPPPFSTTCCISWVSRIDIMWVIFNITLLQNHPRIMLTTHGLFWGGESCSPWVQRNWTPLF